MAFLRPGSIRIYRSVEGHGTPPGIEAYPFQDLAIEVEAYDYHWLELARYGAFVARLDGQSVRSWRRAGDIKHEWDVTPLGAEVAQLRREGPDTLTAPCGECGNPLATHRCDFAGAAE